MLLASAGLSPVLAADPPPFELDGPDLRVEVTRGDRTLPIAKVPSLAAGDKISVQGAFPASQSANFLLVSAFLRGATNPPPKDWIAVAKTWKDKEKDKALSLKVPEGAQHMVLLMVPETGGAEGVLVDAVRGKPGEFVRASQELNQASLDHSRLVAFMAAIRAQDDTGPEYLRTVAPVLASSLSIKLQEDCLNKVIELQASCLVQNREALVLSDVHTSSLADTLTGTPTDLALQLSATPAAGYGYYSAYIGVVRDVARIFGAFNNPQFNYLPSLTERNDTTLSLLLNTAPSFEKPKSVMIAAMPAIEKDIPPQLRSGAKGPVCLAPTGTAAGPVLKVEGGPLVFSTQFAHDMQARLTSASGETVEVPVTPRADKGGYVVDAGKLPASFSGEVRAHLHGLWGFEPFEGPDYLLQRPDPNGQWKLDGDADGLVVGRDNAVVLQGTAPSCIDAVTLRGPNGTTQTLKWQAQEGGRLAVTVPLDGSAAGGYTLDVRQRGAASGQDIALRARVQAARLDGLDLHAGDGQGVLTGQRLDQVRGVTIGDLQFKPEKLDRQGSVDRLRLIAQGDAKAPAEGAALKAAVQLEDGRTLSLPVRIAAARPQAQIIGRTVYPGPASEGAKSLDLGEGDLLPDNGEMVFSVKAANGGTFSAADAIEIAGAEGDAIARLAVGKGLTLESNAVLVATLKAADLPPATFGALRYRLIRAGDTGDWAPLTTIARLPRIESVKCDAKGQCVVTGRQLFLVDAIAPDAAFAAPVPVPPGFTGGTLTVPRPADGLVRLRLRDAPASPVTLPVG